jgi:hypothetical protein
LNVGQRIFYVTYSFISDMSNSIKKRTEMTPKIRDLASVLNYIKGRKTFDRVLNKVSD